MNKLLSALAVLIVTVTSARAQSLDDALSSAKAAAQEMKAAVAQDRAAASAKLESLRVYPVVLVCAPAQEAGLGPSLTFITRLDAALRPGALSDKPATVAWQFGGGQGETAAGLDDYRAITIDKANLHYDLWSCDAQDYSFSFPAADLARDPALKEDVRPVAGRVVIETRGSVDYSGALDCKAYYSFDSFHGSVSNTQLRPSS